MTDNLPDAIPLTERAKRFAEEYCIDFSCAGAERRSGLMPGSGHALLRDPRIEAMIKDVKKRASDRVQISVDSTLETFRIMRDVSIADFVTDKPGTEADNPLYPIKPVSEWTLEMRVAVKSVKMTKFGPTLELHDKVAANTALAKYYGLLIDNHTVSVSSLPALEKIAPEMTPQQAADLYRQSIEAGAKP